MEQLQGVINMILVCDKINLLCLLWCSW